MVLRAVLLGTASLSLAGCAISKSTDQIVLDYNRDFAKSRNEMLLLNVLRAAAREPLQFSTMGTVNGQIGNGGSIRIPFTNLVAGGRNVISPDLTINDAVNPSVAINPLGSKEFASGILRPMGTETIQLFLHNGWDPEFILPLIVGGVVCPDRRLLLNSGEYLDASGKPDPLHEAFKIFFYDAAKSFGVRSERAQDAEKRTYVLTDKETLGAFKDGLGAGYVIDSVQELPDDRKRLTVAPAAQTVVSGLPITKLCQQASVRGVSAQVLGADAVAGIAGGFDVREAQSAGTPPKPGKVLFRSVGSIIQYLGEAHRVRYLAGGGTLLTYLKGDCDPPGANCRRPGLFKVDWGLSRDPKAVQVRFQDTMFFIPRMMLGRKETEDRTLKTLSFLDQLIALQTSESSIKGAQPVISVN